MQFIDECKLVIKAGDGGKGIVSWRKEAHHSQGGPYGGDGGKGGDVVILGDVNINSLFHLRYRKKITAPNGENGQDKQMFGKNGKDTIIKVPIGTQIYNAENNKLIVDIIEKGQKYVIAYGGIGGHGNAYFKSSFNKTPTLYENGDYGQEIIVQMKLKFIANIGLIGKPNAGKSSLLRCLSNAKPKVADYPFTTIVPILGTMNCEQNKNIIIADIPGLIDGASNNVGLGFDFLKHIERCDVLIHVISLDKNDHDDIIANYKIINNELSNYNKDLLNKKQLIVANKSDVLNANEQFLKLKKFLKNKIPIIDISAKTNYNIDKLKQIINQLYKDCQLAKKTVSSNKNIKVIEPKQNITHSKTFTWTRDKNGRWIITSNYLSYWLHKIPQNTKDNIYRFNQKLNNCNIDEILKKHGAKEKDTIIIDNMEFQID